MTMNLRILILTLLITGCSEATPEFEKLAVEISHEKFVKFDSGYWQVGGNLQSANAMAWQKASFQNKRATCSVFLEALIQQNKLNIEDSSDENIKKMSEELVYLLNERFKMVGNAQENEESFKHLKVSNEALIVIKSLKWHKNV